MDKLKKKAISLGASEFGVSTVKNKRFYVIYQGKKINFGLKGGSTFIDHGDSTKRRAWIARHSRITNKEGQYVIKLRTSADFWSKNILW